MRAAVRQLPDGQRRVVELAYFEGLTCREVALAAGIPEGTAKSRLRLALAKLETVLDRQLLEVVMTAGGRKPVVLPAGLRERVLEASRQARAVGRSVPEVTEISPAEAFSRAADAFFGLLCALGDGDWRMPVLRGLNVQGLVGHLIGVEDDVQRCLSGDPEVAEANHVESTQPAAARQAGRPAARTRADWRRAADRTLDLVHAVGDPCAEVAVHGMRLPLGALLVVRSFELWTHRQRHPQGGRAAPVGP